MRIYFIIFFLFGLFDSDAFILIHKIACKTELISSDIAGNVYVYGNGILKKFNKSGEELSNYDNRLNGTLSTFDCSDPFIILLYYRDLNQVVFLDNQMNVLGNPFDLDALNINRTSAICKSKNYAIWLYSDFDQSIVKYQFNQNIILSKINMEPIAFSRVNFLREFGNNLYVSTGNVLLIFNEFGSLIQQKELKIPNQFQIRNNMLYYYKNNYLYIIHLEKNQKDSITLPYKEIINHAGLEQDLLYIQSSDSLFFYQKI